MTDQQNRSQTASGLLDGDVVSPERRREPRGFTTTYTIVLFGLYLATSAPLLGGLSVKVQNLVGLNAAGPQLGLVTGIAAFFALVGQPIAGRLSDRTISRFGMRKPWILIGAVGSTLTLLICGAAPSIPVLIVGFCGVQLFANFIQAAVTAAFADQVPEPRLGVVGGFSQGLSIPASSLAASALLAWLPNDFLRSAVPGAIVLACSAFFLVAFKDRVLLVRPIERISFKEIAGTFIFNPVKHRNLGLAWLSKFCILFGYGAALTYLLLFLGTNLGMKNPNQQLNFFLQVSLLSTLITAVGGIVGGRLSDKLQRRRLFVTIAGVCIAVGTAIVIPGAAFGVPFGLALIWISQALLGIGLGAFFAVDQALCVEVLPDKGDTAKDLGVLNIANALPQMIAPLMASVVFLPLGDKLFGTGGGYQLWFAFGGAVALFGSVVVYKIRGIR